MGVYELLLGKKAESRKAETAGIDADQMNDPASAEADLALQNKIKEQDKLRDMDEAIRKMRGQVRREYEDNKVQLIRDYHKDKEDFHREWKRKEELIERAFKKEGREMTDYLRDAGVSASREHRLGLEQAKKVAMQKYAEEKRKEYRHLQRGLDKGKRELMRSRDDAISQKRTKLRTDINFM